MVRERGKALLVFGLVLGLLVGQSTAASFKECYIPCFIFCILKPNETAFSCSLECLRDCLIPNPPMKNTSSIHTTQTHNTHNFCKLGCASSLCSNLSTKQNPGGEKVESCVGSCSEMCTKNYLSP